MFEIGHDILKHKIKDVRVPRENSRRLSFVYFLFFVLFGLFIARTLYLGLCGNDIRRYNNGRDVVSRADIVDRNGKDILAKDIISGHITVRPVAIAKKDKDAAAALIHDVLPYKYSLRDALALVNSDRKFVYLEKNASDEHRKKIKNAKIYGFDIEPVQMRKYPKRRLFSHVVGFVGTNNHGLEGAERVFDDYLVENAEPLRLSVDTRVQTVFYEQLSIAMDKYGAKGAMGLLMNSRTGEMVAMVSLPDYDPENKNLDPVANRMFRPMRALYEMGSIFKIFNTALAYENGINKEYYVVKPYKILDKFGRVTASIGDVRTFKPPRPNLTVDEIMLHSCNSGSAQIALDLPDGAQKEFFHRLHLDEKLELEFGTTEKSLMPRKWGPVERATVAFGHGVSVTPMHLLLAVNAMTNGGIYVYPTLQKRPLGVIQGERVLSPEISEKLREIMFRITEETSGKKARIKGIEIGGKTATAEKRDANGKIDKMRNLTAFAGVFPINAPQYVLLIILDEPKGVKESFGLRTAAWNAVPTAGKIIDGILPLLFE